MQQRALARAGRADYRHPFAGTDAQIDPAQDRNLLGPDNYLKTSRIQLMFLPPVCAEPEFD